MRKNSAIEIEQAFDSSHYDNEIRIFICNFLMVNVATFSLNSSLLAPFKKPAQANIPDQYHTPSAK